MLGNDIVDLRDVDAQPSSFRPRFDDRVFSADEKAAIAEDANPLARRWAHWAAKEAAYKLAKQVDSTFIFSPGRLVANFGDAHELCANSEMKRIGGRRQRKGRLELPRTLSGELRMLDLRCIESDDWVHVLAIADPYDWSSVESSVAPLEHVNDDPSLAVRTLAIREISARLNVGQGRVSIGRDGRIPFVALDGTRTDSSLSLSHHGGWVGFAVQFSHDMRTSPDWTDRISDIAGEAVRGGCAT